VETENKRVLVVDDEEDILSMTKACLETYGGWEVLLATTGEEALRVAGEVQPAVILMDVMMPGIDGLEATATLRASAPTSAIPIVLFTAKVDPESRAAYALADVQGLIIKPFNPRTVGFELQSLVEAAHRL
jgi:CheY-like chemotaxis protein